MDPDRERRFCSALLHTCAGHQCEIKHDKKSFEISVLIRTSLTLGSVSQSFVHSG